MEGISEMIHEMQVEATFPDGTNSLAFTIQFGEGRAIMIPGEILPASGEIVLNKDRTAISLKVANTGDRPIQVGSHYHFAETNAALAFDRNAALGYRLDIRRARLCASSRASLVKCG